MTALTAPTKHSLGQLRHVDLLALAIEVAAASSDQMQMHFGSWSRDRLIDTLTRPAALARLADRADIRLER